CMLWMIGAYIVVIIAYADFADLLESHPGCNLTLITTIIMICEAIMLMIFICTRSKKNMRKECPEENC
ncbi:hypothetical protein PMAYCL1PPCAC_15210, partial [Pristionchus mayeri]